MKRSAMIQAFQLLRRKPMVLLLILPVQVIALLSSTLSLHLMPDLTKMLDLSNMMNNAEYYSSLNSYGGLQMMNMISLLVSSLTSLISFASMFLLIPPAMELLSDGAAGLETQPGWYIRGLKSHWWKPVVDSLIVGGIYAVIVVPLGFVLYIALIVASVSSLNSITGYGMDYSGSVDSILYGILPTLAIGIVIFVLVVLVVQLIVYSFFGLFLPAMKDRTFGAAFKLMFSKKGFRAFPKLLGGNLLISIVPGAFYLLIGAAYFMIHGAASGPFGFLITMIDFLKSWAGTLALLFVSLFSLLTYAFRFSVYQQVREAEAAAQTQQIQL